MPLSPFGVGGWTAASAADLLELSSIVSALFNRFAHSAGPGVEGSWSWGVRLSWKSVAHRSTAKQREAQRSTEKHREAQRSTQKHTEALRSTEEHREAQGSTQKHTEAQRSTQK